MSRRSSISVSLTTASTALSSPVPGDDYDNTFGDLFGTAVDTPGPTITGFEDTFSAAGPLKSENTTDGLFDAMVDFDVEPLTMGKHSVEDFVNFDQHDFHDQDHFVIFSGET